MLHATGRSDYHPRWLRQPLSTYWWLEKPSYFAFILREASCIFVAWFVVYLLMLVDAVNAGPPAYQALLDWSATPAILVLNVVSFLFLVFHAVTFFDAAPQAMVVHLGGKRVPGQLIGLGHYAAWAVVSVGIAWILVGA